MSTSNENKSNTTSIHSPTPNQDYILSTSITPSEAETIRRKNSFVNYVHSERLLLEIERLFEDVRRPENHGIRPATYLTNRLHRASVVGIGDDHVINAIDRMRKRVKDNASVHQVVSEALEIGKRMDHEPSASLIERIQGFLQNLGPQPSRNRALVDAWITKGSEFARYPDTHPTPLLNDVVRSFSRAVGNLFFKDEVYPAYKAEM